MRQEKPCTSFKVVSNTKRVIADKQFLLKPSMEAFVQEEMARCGVSGAELIVVSTGDNRNKVMPYGILSNFDGNWEGSMGLSGHTMRQVIVDLDDDGDPADPTMKQARKMISDLFANIRKG